MRKWLLAVLVTTVVAASVGWVLQTPISPPISTASSPITPGDIHNTTFDGTMPLHFRYVAEITDSITISAQSLAPTSPDLDVRIRVFNANGSEVAYNDDHTSSLPGLGVRDAAIIGLAVESGQAYHILIDTWFGEPGTLQIRLF